MHHLELYVADLGKTAQFYHCLLVQLLGFELDAHWERGLSFHQGETYIVFVEVAPEKKEISYNRTHIGLNHLAFWAESQVLVDRLHDAMTSQNPAALLYDHLYPFAGGVNHYALYLEDPDHVKIEVIARR